MEVGAQIRKYRSNMGISQEQLAEKVYVSRQTVSNWDQLIKGDVERMRKEIKETEIRRLNRYGNIYAALLALTVLSAVPLAAWMGWYALIPWAALAGVTMYFAVKVEKVKKDNDIHTYKEIVAFTEGRRLDEMETQQELGKRHYQTVLYALGSAAIGFIVSFFLAKLFLA